MKTKTLSPKFLSAFRTQLAALRFTLYDAAQAEGALRRAATRDELLEPITSGQQLALGTQWSGYGENPKLDTAVGAVADIVGKGMALGHILHATSPGTVIDLARQWAPHLEDEDQREQLSRAVDDAEQEWRRDPRSRDAGFEEPLPLEGEQEPLLEYAEDGRRAARSGFFDTRRTAAWADGMKRGRDAMERGEPPPSSPPGRVQDSRPVVPRQGQPVHLRKRQGDFVGITPARYEAGLKAKRAEWEAAS